MSESESEWGAIRSRLNRARIARIEADIRNDVVQFRQKAPAAPSDDEQRARNEQAARAALARGDAIFHEILCGRIMGILVPESVRRSFAQRLAAIDALLECMQKP
jgi:hypothetical protein